jgi:hypothetical protein
MESWTIMPCAVVFDSSCANLTRASIEKKAFNPRGWIVGISAVFNGLCPAMTWMGHKALERPWTIAAIRRTVTPSPAAMHNNPGACD